MLQILSEIVTYFCLENGKIRYSERTKPAQCFQHWRASNNQPEICRMTAETNHRTPSLREAAQLALDALTHWHAGHVWDADGVTPDAIAALRVALALPDEPVRVYLVATGEITNGMEQYTRHDTLPPMADYETLYATPQPAEPKAAPVERKPLTNNEIHLAMDTAGIEANGMPFSKELQIARVIEALHGIKGAA